MKKIIFTTILGLILLFLVTTPLDAVSLSQRLSGKILLQIQEHGEAWYVNPITQIRAFLGRPADAFQIMREQGLGVSEKDYASFGNYAPSRLSGRILLRVQANGEAYYVNPVDLKMHYLARPADAFRVMRELGLGITNADLEYIPFIPQPLSDIPQPLSDIPQPSFTVISPNGGEEWTIGSSYTVTWTSNNLPTEAQNRISISLYPKGYSPGDKVAVSLIGSASNTGSYSGVVPDHSSLPPGEYKIKVGYFPQGDAYGPGHAEDISDNYFSIVEAPTSSITLTSPKFADNFVGGETLDITWDSVGVNKVHIELEKDDSHGTRITAWPIAYNVAASIGKYSWQIPLDQDTGALGYKIVIWDSEHLDGPQDASDLFSIFESVPCTDSDGGKDYDVKGTATGIQRNGNFKTTLTDTCMTDNRAQVPEGDSIIEHYCDGIYREVSYYKCPYGCKDGACQSASTSLSPNGGEEWLVGKTYNIKWLTSGYNSSALVQISLRDIRHDPNTPQGEATIANIINSGSYTWTIPSQFKYMTLGAGNVYKIVIYIEGVSRDTSDNYFSITQPFITVISPNGGEVWKSGETHRVSWESVEVDSVMIYIFDPSISGSGSTNCITPDGLPVSAASGYYDWTISSKPFIPGGSGNNYKIMVDDVTYPDIDINDSSDDFFSIALP